MVSKAKTYEERIKQLKRRAEAAHDREAIKSCAQETRRQIILGRYLETEINVKEIVDGIKESKDFDLFLVTDNDRKLFGRKPLTEEERKERKEKGKTKNKNKILNKMPSKIEKTAPESKNGQATQEEKEEGTENGINGSEVSNNQTSGTLQKPLQKQRKKGRMLQYSGAGSSKSLSAWYE
jgi:hypothetical protein